MLPTRNRIPGNSFLCSLALLGISVGGLGCSGRSGGHGESGSMLPDLSGYCGETSAAQMPNVPYASIAGIDQNLLSLDIYAPARGRACQPAPIVVWVHGGGWHAGDKSNQIPDKQSLFNGAGYLLISLNYRLSPEPPSSDPQRVMYPTHANDVGKALGFIAAHAAEWGGDATRIALLGHSAGAQIVALLGTDPSLLNATGQNLSLLRCIGSFDTEGYDIPTTLQTAAGSQRAIYENAFGTDPAVWTRASPITYVAAGRGIPKFLLVSRGEPERRAQAEAFRARLAQAGVAVSVIDATGLSHEDVNRSIGAAGDAVMTPAVSAFLADCLK